MSFRDFTETFLGTHKIDPKLRVKYCRPNPRETRRQTPSPAPCAEVKRQQEVASTGLARVQATRSLAKDHAAAEERKVHYTEKIDRLLHARTPRTRTLLDSILCQ